MEAKPADIGLCRNCVHLADDGWCGIHVAIRAGSVKICAQRKERLPGMVYAVDGQPDFLKDGVSNN